MTLDKFKNAANSIKDSAWMSSEELGDMLLATQNLFNAAIKVPEGTKGVAATLAEKGLAVLVAKCAKPEAAVPAFQVFGSLLEADLFHDEVKMAVSDNIVAFDSWALLLKLQNQFQGSGANFESRYG